jgi:hypothetical protein
VTKAADSGSTAGDRPALRAAEAADEIGITPQMIEAGIGIFLKWEEGENYQIADLVRDLYRVALSRSRPLRAQMGYLEGALEADGHLVHSRNLPSCGNRIMHPEDKSSRAAKDADPADLLMARLANMPPKPHKDEPKRRGVAVDRPTRNKAKKAKPTRNGD